MLNETALSYKMTRVNNATGNYFEVSVTNDTSSGFIKVFSTQDQTDNQVSIDKFARAFPVRFNVHAGAWYNKVDTNDMTTIHLGHMADLPVDASEFTYFKYTNEQGGVPAEEEFTLDS